MLLTDEARTTRKKAQLARLERKSDPDYPVIYASQPSEIQKGAEQRAERIRLRAIKNQAAKAAIDAAESAISVFGGSMQTVAGDSTKPESGK
jgi:alkylation response protein AidB-like acyl-CoA dehydrogenase